MTGFVVQGHKYKNIEMISVKCSTAVHKDSYCRMKDIDGLDCSFALLLESKHQVNPLAQRLRDLIRFQSLSVDEDEESRVIPDPRRQIHVVHPLAVLPHAEVKTCQRGKREIPR